jgi:hypothetical protein
MKIWVSHNGSDTMVAYNPKPPGSIHFHTNLGWVRVEAELDDGETLEIAAERIAKGYELVEQKAEEEEEETT